MTTEQIEEFEERRLKVTIFFNKITDKDDPSIGERHAVQNLRMLENIGGFGKVMLTNEVLNDLLKEVGNTPLAEPKLVKLLNRGDKAGVIKHFKSKEENKEIDFDAFEFVEIASFIKLVNDRIFEFKDENNIYKTTPRTKDKHIGNFVMFELEDQIKEIEKLRSDRLLEESDFTKMTEEMEKKQKELEEKILKESGLNVEELTEWERELVINDTIAIIKNEENSLGGF